MKNFPNQIQISPTYDLTTGVMRTVDAIRVALYNKNDGELHMIGEVDCQSDTTVTTLQIKEAVHELMREL